MTPHLPLPDAPASPTPNAAPAVVSHPALAWAGRLLAGSLLAMSYAGSVVVVGFLYRWVQGRVLFTWWRRSPARGRLSFEQFCAEVGPDAPRLLPRLLLPEAGAGGPLLSLWVNARTGFLGLLSTFLLSGWGGLLMAFSWEYGWLVSFDKAHEVGRVGLLTGLAGAALFVAAMAYVPMAQVHQAVTGDFRAFFEFRFVCRLIRARVGGYVLFAALFLDFAVALEILKTLPTGFDDLMPLFTNASDRELLWLFRGYYLGCSLFLLLSLLATRLIVLHLYAGAVLDVVRHGPGSRDELHPRLTAWLARLELVSPARRPARRGWGGRLGQAAMLAVLLAVWFAFVAKVYVGEFFNYHPGFGFVNHPLVQAPCCNYIPSHLGEAD
jgi:hypothetical protein